MTKQRFPWGNISEVHRIGDHEITEYVVGAQWQDAGTTEFLVDDSVSWDTLEEAMIASVCKKLVPGDPDLPSYVLRLIGNKETAK